MLSNTDEINKKYPLEVWYTTILVSPFIILIYYIAKDFREFNFELSLLMFLLLSIAFAGAISLPTLFIYYLAFKELKKSHLHVFLIKAGLAIIGIIGVIITFYLLNPKSPPSLLDMDIIAFPIIYSLTILINSFLFKIKIT